MFKNEISCNEYCTDTMFLVGMVCVTYSYTILSLIILNFKQWCTLMNPVLQYILIENKFKYSVLVQFIGSKSCSVRPVI